MLRKRVRFEGSVQGVGFRATARAMAAGFAVTGWVRNEQDGSVLSEVQGRPDDVERYLAALRGRMDRLIHSEVAESIPVLPSESGFAIRH